MNCQKCSELMVDILYDEEVPPRTTYEFFRHLGECAECNAEYLELIETREGLSEWKLNEHPGPDEILKDPPSIVDLGFMKRGDWWTLMQRVAAGVLILVGIFSILQNLGVLPRQQVPPSDEQLAEMVHDIVVAKQVEDWKVIGSALLSLKEELEDQNRLEIRSIYEEMYSLEQRTVQALEENNQNVKTLLSR